MKLSEVLTIVVISALFGTATNQQVLGYFSSEPEKINGFQVTLSSDKESYIMGEVIRLSGSVNKFEEGRQIQITMFDPSEKVILNEKIQVNSDGTFSYDIAKNDKIKIDGSYSIRAQYGRSNSNVEKISFIIKAGDIPNAGSVSTTNIPGWVKNNAGWWAAGSIDDNSFIQGIQFMIKEGIITVE